VADVLPEKHSIPAETAFSLLSDQSCEVEGGWYPVPPHEVSFTILFEDSERQSFPLFLLKFGTNFCLV